MENDNIKKIEKFFEYNLNVKKIVNQIIPKETDCYDMGSTFLYIDRLQEGIDRINTYINKMIIDYELPNEILMQFNKKIQQFQRRIDSNEFNIVVSQGYTSLLKFIEDSVTKMREEFVDSVKKGLIGYYLYYGEGVLEPTTINEFLHYIHSYVINNEKVYKQLPILNSSKTQDGYGSICMRGAQNQLCEELYLGLTNTAVESSQLDIISLNKKILIMARDLGHASVIEIDTSNEEDIFVQYFIPKNTNIQKTSLLKGIYENKEEFATGSFQSNKETFVQDIANFVLGIPTDLDMEEINYNRI